MKALPITIVIADDHEIFRDGFKMMVQRETDFQVIGEASNGQELVTIANELQPDVIVTDIKMPIMDGIEAARILNEKNTTSKIVALTMFDDENIILAMLEAGADGYLLKNANKSEILDAIRTVFRNEPYYCNYTAHKLAHIISKSGFNPFKRKQPAFTDREKQIIKLICQGLSSKELATRLNLSIRTIEGHKERIFEKINVKNIASLVVFAIKNDLYKI